jgi:hypothetical protein
LRILSPSRRPVRPTAPGRAWLIAWGELSFRRRCHQRTHVTVGKIIHRHNQFSRFNLPDGA